MNTLLLIFFALPIAVIILSIALQKILRNPFLVGGIIFSIFLIVTFVIGDSIYLVATIAYTILAFITAIITKIICRVVRELDERECNRRRCECSLSSNNDTNNGTQLLSINGSTSDNGNLLTISSNGCNGIENQLLTINSNCSGNNNDNDNDNTTCGCFRRR